MVADLVFSKGSAIVKALADAAKSKKIIFFAGLPGTGKSLFLQQQALLASQAGKNVHLMQWDIAREPFETPEQLEQFPEIDGVTHPVIRKAVGLWARRGLQKWLADYPNPDQLLIGELPVVGGRFVELLQSHEDGLEPVLAGTDSVFFLPVPSVSVREHIEQARATTISAPRHEREKRDAPPNVVQQHWQAIYDLGVQLKLAERTAHPAYDADIYCKVFQHLMRNRKTEVLAVDEIYSSPGSVYDLTMQTADLRASDADVQASYQRVEAEFPGDLCVQSVENWHRI